MSEQRKKYKDMSKEEIDKEYMCCLLNSLSEEKLQDFLIVAKAFVSGDFSSMPKSYWEFVLKDEKASEEEKEKAREALLEKTA